MTSINLIPNTGGCSCTSSLGCGHVPHAAPQSCTAKESRRTRARVTTLGSRRDHQPSKGTVLTTDAPPSSPALDGIASLDVLVHRCCHHGQNHCRSHTSATPMRVSLQRTTHALPAPALHLLNAFINRLLWHWSVGPTGYGPSTANANGGHSKVRFGLVA